MPPEQDRERDAPPFWARHIEGIVYLAAGLTYIVLGIWQKGLLNWIAGPAWLVLWVWVILPPLRRRAMRAGADVA